VPRRPGPVWNRSRTTSQVSCPGCGKSSRRRLLRLMVTRMCDRPIDILFTQTKFQSRLLSFNGRCAIMNEMHLALGSSRQFRDTGISDSAFHYLNTSRSYGEMSDVHRYPSGCFGMISFPCISTIVSILSKLQSQHLPQQYHTVLVVSSRLSSLPRTNCKKLPLKKTMLFLFHLSSFGIQKPAGYSQQGASSMY
jgi:hypothetical protein